MLVEVVLAKELVGNVERLSDGEYDLRGQVLVLAREHVTVVVSAWFGLSGECKVVEVVLILTNVVYVLDIIVA